MVKTRAEAHNGQLSPCVGSGRGFEGFLGLRERLFSLAKCCRGRSYPRQVDFGIVLLEMLIGKRPTEAMFEDELTIVSFVERNFPDQMLHIIDAHL
ncbi:hypothetical protein EJB05_20797, partial [Eragrostis curvula]